MKANAFSLVAVLVTLWLCTENNVHAQAAKFGKIDEAELALKQYPLDTAAEAVVLSDFGFTRFIFTSGAQVVTTRHMRIKILKKSGYNWANIEVPFYINPPGKERVASIKGYTYNLENGKVQKDKLDTKGVFEEQHNENWFSKKFTMPNVKVGSVIDVEYTIYSDFIYNMRGWEFQTSIPTVWSEYQAQIPEYYDYKFLLKGYHELATKSKYGPGMPELEGTAYVWRMKDVPALREERYITTLSDYQAKIEFELQQVKYPGEQPRTMTGSWESITSKLLAEDEFGMQLNRSGYFKDQLATIMAANKTPQKQLEAIYAFVQNNMQWDGKYRYYTEESVKKSFEKKTGNSAEVNLLLTAMLLEAGFDAAPVLVSTRSHGRPAKDSPIVNTFNYVITHVKTDNKEILLDATDPLLPFGSLPMRALNGEGRLIKKTDQRWVALKPMANAVYTSSDIVLQGDGALTAKVKETAGGYYALNIRQQLKEDGEKEVIDNLRQEIGEYKISEHNFENKHNPAESLNLHYTITSAGNGQPNTLLYLNPLLGHGEKENPFKAANRRYPVDFATPIDETIVTKYTLPEGYVLEEVPASVNVMLPENGGKFMYMVQQYGNVLQVMSRVNINKPVFYAEEYPYLKEFYNQIIAKHAEQIVLKKAVAN